MIGWSKCPQNQHDQKIKKDVKLNEFADTFNYTDERKKRLSENYNKTKPSNNL